MKTKKLPSKFRDWIDARKKHHLSHAHIQMARELGLNPKKMGKIDNHKQEPWKAPLPVFLEEIYYKRFSKTSPDEVKTIEQLFRLQQQKKAIKKAKKLEARKLIAPILEEPVAPDLLSGGDISGKITEEELMRLMKAQKDIW